MSLEGSQSNAAPSQRNKSQFDVLVKELPASYEIIEKVAEGGMGAIYKALNHDTNSFCAIKVLRSGASNVDNAIDRFIIEAKAASTLVHPNICQLRDFGLTEPSYIAYMAMDWIDGTSLRERVDHGSRLTVKEALPIFQQIASAIAHAHKMQVVHRDLKPENILISRDHTKRLDAHLIDFGVAKLLDEEQGRTLTQTGTVVGSPLFMSPEQAKGDVLDRRTDIYSLGCVMYFAISGRPPFVGDSVIQTISKHISERPPAFDSQLKIPTDLNMIIFKSLEKNPDDRYQSMDDLSVDLKKLSKGVKIAPLLVPTERLKKRKLLFNAVLGCIAFAVTIAISIAWQNWMDGANSHPAVRSPAGHNHMKTHFH